MDDGRSGHGNPLHDSLHFADAVVNAFSYLADYGFRVTHAEPTLVRYGAAGRYITIFHGERSYAVGIKFGFGDGPEDEVSFPEVAYAFGGRYREFGGHTAAGVAAALSSLATEVLKYPDALKGVLPDDRVQQYRRRLTEYYAGTRSVSPDQENRKLP